MPQALLNVLLVEDNLADANLLLDLLSDDTNSSWQIAYARRLKDAIHYLEERDFDVALLDLSLPDSQGLDTVRQFCQAAGTLPVVVLTGMNDPEIALQAMAAGAQDYLVKGQITAELLERTVHYAIERHQIIQRLKDSERRFRGVFEQTFQAMSLLTPDGIVIEPNQTVVNLSGSQPEQIVGLPIWEIPHWKFLPENQERLQRGVELAAQGELVRFESQICNAHNQIVWVDFSLKPIRDEQGKVVLLIAEGRDISDRKRAEVEIQRSLNQERELNHLKSSFISMVSHEFRTPMTSIRVCSELLQQDLMPDQQQQYFNRIQDALNQMLHLLDGVLLLGYTEARQFQSEPTRFDLENFCRELTETFQFNVGQQHNIRYTYEGKSTWIEMDQSLLHHVLANLLSNAIKYSPNGGVIELDVKSDREVTFCIRDEGVGIPLKDQERLFEPFHRARNVKGTQGTGLGLAIVKNCLQLLGGEIQFESQEGVGTTFVVTLPTRSQASLSQN